MEKKSVSDAGVIDIIPVNLNELINRSTSNVLVIESLMKPISNNVADAKITSQIAEPNASLSKLPEN